MRLIRLLKHDLAREIVSWVEAGIISSEQAESICARYGLDYHRLSRRTVGYAALIVLGNLFIGLALITLIGANWEDIPRGLRMSGLVALTVGTNLFGLSRFRKEEKSAVPIFFLGSLFYGASIMLIAQIYHIDEHYPDGIFWWAMGVLPLAMLLESSFLMILAVCLGYLWFFVESFLNFYPLLFPIFLTGILWHLWRGKQSYVLFMLLVAGVVFWAEFTLAWFMSPDPRFKPGAENVALCVGIFFALHGISKLLERRPEPVLIDYGAVLGLWVLRFAILSLLVFSFEFSWKELMDAGWKAPTLIVCISVLLTAISVFLVYRAGQPVLLNVVLGIFFIACLITLINVNNKEYAQVFQIIDNFMLVVSGAWLISTGIQKSISHYFYFGVITILITGLLRYINFIGDYIGTACLFAVFAAVLLLSARFWKSRSLRVGSGL